MPIEINRESKKLGKLKEGSSWDITFKHLLIFINTLENTNKLVVLYCLTPLLILEKGAALEEQTINSSIL